MRKVKLLAFVLAALMVVAAFAGCGTKEIEANVTDLDERVTKLEELLNKVNASVEKGATADQIDELLDAITANKAAADKADSDLTDKLGQIAKDNAAALEALKKDNAAALDALKKSLEGKDSDLSKALESLTKSLEETNKAIAANKTSTDTAIANAITELNKAIEALKTSQDTTDAEQDKKINDLIASLDKTLGELNTKLDELGKTDSLDALKESYIDRLESKEADLAVNSIDYTADEINKLTTIIAAGKTNIRAAATEEKVAEAYDAVAKEIDKYVPVAKQLANAIDAKLGTIKHDTNLTSLEEIYNKAVAHYAGGVTSKSLTEYGANKRNLVDEYAAIGTAKTEAGTIKTKAETIVTAVNGVKQAGGVILGTNNTTVATQYNAYLAFIAQVDANKWLNKSALKALVTNADLLLQYQARISVLVQAQTAYAVLGGYDDTFVNTVSVFKAYNDLANKTLYTTKNVYDATTEKLNSWMTAYGLDYADTAGKANIKYIIGTEADYDVYLANQKKVNALNDKYTAFVADIVSRVLAFEKLTVINDTNIAERAAINEAVTAWKKVWDANASQGISAFSVDDANYAEMIKNGFNDGRTELFKYNDATKTFYTTIYAAAEAYAAKINTVIDKLAKDFKDGKNFNTVLVFKELYGYEYKADKGGYVLAAKVSAELTTDPTIKSFIDIYKKDQYDLTSLLHMTAYNDTLKAVEDRIAAYQATAKSITDKYDAIVKKMTDTDHITDVNLTYETAVNEVYAIYAGMTGFNAEMASWGLKKDKTDVWEFTDLMKKETYEGVYELKNDIDVLRAAADKLVEFYGVLTKAFAKTNVKADDDVTEVLAKFDQYTSGSGSSAVTKYSYISKVELTGGSYVYTYVKDNATAPTDSNCMTIAEVAELGDTIYNWFTAQNGGKKYDAVETARNAAFDSQKLLVVKSYAINAVLEAAKGANYDKTYGFNVCQDTAVAKILAVKSIKAVAEEVHHFVVEAGADYSNTNNTGAYIAAITFGMKDGNAVTVIGKNGDGVAFTAPPVQA